ncbi:MAG: flavodoxin family protein, partial [Chloroflexi bacterium]|nr:flavodoxin family protein [Chloroflexota bacterium]
MKIVILNGNGSDSEAGFDGYLEELSALLESHHHTVTMLKLRVMDIRLCIGCWDCWLKTPGLCRVRDGSDEVCRECINSDLVLFASPVVMGFTWPLSAGLPDLTPVMRQPTEALLARPPATTRLRCSLRA